MDTHWVYSRPLKIRIKYESFYSTIAQAMRMDTLQALLEPLLRRVVSEEIERVITNRIPANLRPPPRQIQGPGSRKLRLQFQNKLSLPLFTGSKIEGEQGFNLQIILLDIATQQRVTSGPESLQKVEIVVLEGDFGHDDEDEWTVEDFDNYVVRERDGKRPLLTGELVVSMKDGLATLGELSFTDNSSWIRSRKFRLGARVTGANHDGIRIKEAKTEAFTVKDHRGELYKKHYPPALLDDVWRLDRIGKEGAFHKKLSSESIKTVMDFLRELNRNPQGLRQILGNGMSTKMWEGTVEHARTCILNNKQYVYNPPHQNNGSVIFNVVYAPVAVNWADGRLIAWNSISEAETPWAEKLVKSAYQHWPNGVRELEDGYLMNNTAHLLALQHTPVQVLEGNGNPGYQGMALLSQQDEQAAHLDAKSEMVGRQQPMKYSSNDWLQPSESVNMVDSTEVAMVTGFMHQGMAPQPVESPSLALAPRLTSTYQYTLPYQQANLNSHIYRNSHRNQYPDIIKNDWASEPNEGQGGFYHSNSSNDLVNRCAENEDILFRFCSGGTAEQGYNFFPNTPGEQMFNFTHLPPTANFGFNMSGDRLHGKAYMGWLKLKAALKWGISVRKVVAAKKAKVEELED
ncbi:calmodulin-binding protein 60 F isoform X2 [Cryptomeria japonica]|uniref:calmodulin-binding protein 60 F isoform X2 n=1 Tax=Cryptomeria japonica TaxID=3369 RepID=UPI0027D9DB60|nr:calmodulin-binding protein 60 F isoform X2 [Cryptomeria japonica]